MQNELERIKFSQRFQHGFMLLSGLLFVLAAFCACGGENTAPGAVVSGAASSAAPALTTAPLLSPSLAHAPYQPGDRGEDIKLLQNMLAELGFDPGDVDSVFDAQLEKAIRNFQLYAGLDVNGVADDETIDALKSRYDEAITCISQAEQPLKGVVIGLDPGHQRTGNSDLEPERPGSSQMKKKVSSGTEGRFTGVPEYVVNLQVSLKLKKALESLGAQIVMTRKTHDADISNVDRAMMMNRSNVDCWLRIHANGSDNPDANGMFMLVPAVGSMATDDPGVQERSVALAETLLQSVQSSTGAKSLGIQFRSDQTGFGWSKAPVCTIEMGHMTNKTEECQIVSESYQNKIVQGLTEGFIAYFQ
jgi:N-acetylmuramoyl-L-alanine amidase